MRVFLDTNILLDIIEKRLPFYPASQAMLDRCDELHADHFIAWHGLATVFYIVAKKQGEPCATSVIHDLLSWATVSTVGHPEAEEALYYGITDYEDAMQAAAAKACPAAWLVTRDASGFSGSPVPPISPEEFLRRFGTPNLS